MLTKIQKLGETREEATLRLFQPGCEASSEEEYNSLHPNSATIEYSTGPGHVYLSSLMVALRVSASV